MREKLSVTVIALNEAKRIGACLESVSFADEIVVIDSGSTDETAAIARHHGARVAQQSWLGYGRQKQFATEQAANHWVLSLDADERVSDELRASIVAALAAPDFHAYEFSRCNRFMGRWLRHGEGYPDRSLRLFHRAHARWSEDPVHEKVIADGPVGRLRGDLLHDSAQSLEDYLAKQNRYTTLQAERLHAAGKRGSVIKLLLSPLFRFVKFYFLRLGFLDGSPGLVHISIGCFNSFTKQAKLLRLARTTAAR